MKKIIKNLALLLCISLLLTALAACSETKKTEDRDFSLSTLSPVDPDTVPEGAKEFSAVKPGTYTILCHSDVNGLLGKTGESDDIAEKEIYLRNAALSEKYSIELKELNITGNIVDFVRNSTLSGLVNYDIASLTYREAMLLTVSNSLCPLSDLGGYYQNREMFSSSLSVGGQQYIEDFNVFAPRADSTYALALNRELLKSASLEDSMLRSVSRGEWTYETVHGFLRGNGTVGFSTGGIEALWLGGGVHFFENGMGDLPAYKNLEAKANDVYSALKKLNDEGYLERTKSVEGENTFVKIAKRTLLTVGTVGQIAAAKREGLDLALLPMPKQAKEDKYSSFVSPDALCTVVPAGDEEKNSVAFALTGMLYEYDLDRVRREVFSPSDGDSNSREGEMFDIVLSSRALDLPAVYGIGGLYEYLDESLRHYLIPKAFLEGVDDRIQMAVAAVEIMRENGR